MKNYCHNLFTLLSDISQIENKKKLINTFSSKIKSIYTNIDIIWEDNNKLYLGSSDKVEIKTLNKIFGYIYINDKIEPDEKINIQNLAKIVAIYIEHIEQTQFLKNNEIFLKAKIDNKIAELKLSEKNWKNIFEAIGSPTFILDTNFNIIYANKAALKLTNSEIEALKGKKCYRLMHDKNQPPQHCPLKEYLKTGRIEFREMIVETLNKVFLVSCTPITNGNSVVEKIIHIATDITERVRVEKALAENEQILNEVGKIAKIGGWELNLISRKGKWTRATYDIIEIGYNDPVPGFDEHLYYYLPEYRPIVENALNELIENGVSLEFEAMFRSAKGNIGWAKVYGRRIMKNNKCIKVYGTIQDITKLKQVEEELIKQNNYIKTILDNLPIGIAVNEIDTGSATYLNKKFEEIYGWPGELMKDIPTFFQVVYPDPIYREEIMTKILNDLQSGDANRMIWDNISVTHQDGTEREVMAKNIPIPEINLMISTVQDVTERNRATCEIRESEELYRQLFEAESDAIFLINNETGQILEANFAAEKLYGYKKSELINFKNTDLSAEPDKTRETTLAEPVVKDNIVVIPLRYHKKKNGTVFMVEITARFFDWKGKSVHIAAIRDISERVIGEQELIKNKNQLADALLINQIGPWEYDVIKDEFTFNDYFYAVFKTTAEEMGGYKIKPSVYASKFVHPDDSYMVDREMKQAFETNDPNFSKSLEHRIKYSNGETGYISVRYFIVKDENGKTIKTYGVNQNITEKKKAEIAISESEKRYRDLTEFLPITIFELDNKGNLVYANKFGKNLFGFSDNDILNGIHISAILDEEDYKKAIFYIDGILRGIAETGNEYKAIKKNGELIDVLIFNDPIFEGEKHKGWRGSIIDITDRKKIEQTLKISEEKFAKLFHSSPDAITLTRISDRIIAEVNQSACKITGYSREELIGQPILSTKFWANKKELKEYTNLINKNKRVINYEAGFKMKSGNLKTGLVSGEVIQLNNELYVLGIIRDITDRKIAEDKLHASENTLKIFVEFAPAAIAMFDNEMNYLAVSQRFINDYRIKTKIIIGKSHYEIFPEINDEIKKVHKRCLNGSVEKCESDPFPREDGTIDWVRWESRPWYNENSKIGGLLLFSEVITKQKLVEEAIIKTNNELKSLYNNLDEAIFSFNVKKNKMLQVSIAHETIFGYPVKEFYKNPQMWYELIFTEDRYLVDEGYSVLASGQKHKHVVRIKHKNGQTKWIEAKMNPTLDETGNLVHVDGIITDITERKKAQDEIIFAKQKAEESDKLKSAFLANMSHEIRTPMNAILGFSRLLGNTDLTKEKREEYSKIVNDSGNQLLFLIDDIIDISKIESNQLNISIRPCDIHRMLPEIVNFFNNSPKLKDKKEVKLYAELPAGLNECIIETDQERLRQIFNNTINNAIKFTEKGFIEIGYSIQDGTEDKKILFYVKDTGKGIPMDKHNIIFKRFRQGNEFEYHEGTGIGLSISKGIIEMLGGSIWFETKVNQGTTFFFTIPYTDKYKNIQISSVKKAIGNSEKDWSNKLLLIAEDDLPSLHYIKEILSETKIKIHASTNGEELLALLAKHTPDIILLDMNMPVLNGFGAIKIIRNKNITVPVIAQTAYAMENEKEKVIQAGCTAYISKPFTQDKLISLLEKYLY